MRTAIFISHPEVVIDPDLPVPRWQLSDAGCARMRRFAASGLIEQLGAVWASEERKAIEAAGLLSAWFGLPVRVEPRLGENDRSATGFLPPAEFAAVAKAFFADPDRSIRGWETAVDAQARIVAAVEAVLGGSPEGDVAIVAHGGVGTLLLCHLLGVAIDQRYDQPFQGHFWTFDINTRRVHHSWRAIAPKG